MMSWFENCKNKVCEFICNLWNSFLEVVSKVVFGIGVFFVVLLLSLFNYWLLNWSYDLVINLNSNFYIFCLLRDLKLDHFLSAYTSIVAVLLLGYLVKRDEREEKKKLVKIKLASSEVVNTLQLLKQSVNDIYEFIKVKEIEYFNSKNLIEVKVFRQYIYEFSSRSSLVLNILETLKVKNSNSLPEIVQRVVEVENAFKSFDESLNSTLDLNGKTFSFFNFDNEPASRELLISVKENYFKLIICINNATYQ